MTFRCVKAVYEECDHFGSAEPVRGNRSDFLRFCIFELELSA
jgi:hypothetical protein